MRGRLLRDCLQLSLPHPQAMGYGYPLILQLPRASMALTPAQISKNKARMANLSETEILQLNETERDALARFEGQFEELEAALGMLHLGHHVGWKPLVLIHNKRTIRKYEEILGINIREFFPEEGPSADRSMGYVIAKKLGNFWKAVSGELKDDELKKNRRELS